MKKKIITLLFVLMFCLCTAVSAFASDGFVNEYCRVNDLANLLTDSEEAVLLQKLDEVSRRQKIDVTVVTVNDLDGYASATEYADAVYEQYKYGYGTERDGIMLLISMANRDWAISTCGYGITAFTDAGIEYIWNQINSDISNGKYSAAFNTYADLCDEFISQARNGSPFDTGNLPREPLSIIWIPISIVIGVLLALIIVGSMKGKLKTVRSRAEANNYIKKDSLTLTQSNDLFLYHTVDRTKREKDNDSGSSTHTSSSGTTHGGGSGKF